MVSILRLLKLEPGRASADYVENKGQFHLHGLLTEQRHPATWDLGFKVRSNTEDGLRAILSVDKDVSRRLGELACDLGKIESAVRAVVDAVRSGRRIYVYGCGATGRLAKQMESTFWRPFWQRLERMDCWKRICSVIPTGIADALVGEMTGADRALVSSLEGFEDLMLLGELQLEDHGVSRGDVVICLTEGGETSSVIGTVLAAVAQYRGRHGEGSGELDAGSCEEARRHLYFLYNNPKEVLRPFDRSRAVIENPAITLINLTTGPQAIAGSTRMQATTIGTFVVGVVLEEAISRLLRDQLAGPELEELGLGGDPGLATRLRSFDAVAAAVSRSVPDLARLAELEAATYDHGGLATYFACQAMITVFIDCAERSPTFRLFPLDEVGTEEPRCWVHVWTEANDARGAWLRLLGRPFRGLDPGRYRLQLQERVDDPLLRETALASLQNAGDEQELRYDFSFSPSNLERRRPRRGDLGVAVLLDEDLEMPTHPDSSLQRFQSAFRDVGAALAVVRVAGRGVASGPAGILTVEVDLDADDPLTLRRHVALKMLLNALSTATMARLGRIVGNTMTNVSPNNLKLVGRATSLIMSHVNDILVQPDWIETHGRVESITFAEANAVLFDAMSWVRSREMGQTAEVALCIVRILECVRLGTDRGFEGARALLQKTRLGAYLAQHNPALSSSSEPPAPYRPATPPWTAAGS